MFQDKTIQMSANVGRKGGYPLVASVVIRLCKSHNMQARWLLLTGVLEGDSTNSTYVFCKDVLGYNLAGFFERQSPRIKVELEKVLAILLQA